MQRLIFSIGDTNTPIKFGLVGVEWDNIKTQLLTIFDNNLLIAIVRNTNKDFDIYFYTKKFNKKLGIIPWSFTGPENLKCTVEANVNYIDYVLVNIYNKKFNYINNENLLTYLLSKQIKQDTYLTQEI